MDKQSEKYWSEALLILKNEFTEVTFETLIRALTPLYIEGEVFYIKSPNKFFKETIDLRYLSTISSTLRSVTNVQNICAEIVTGEEFKKSVQKQAPSNLVPKYIFDNFVKAKSNELAYATAIAVAESPGTTSYNPLFLYGGVGLGKTHLMHSIGNHIKEKNPDTKVLYCSTETFMNEMIASIQQSKNLQFREKYRDTDVLLVDDIQFLSGKDGTQEEFFHTFNVLRDANKQIVITSDKPPKEIQTLEERLISRFGQGIIIDLKLPDFETRVAILEKKAQADNIQIPYDVNVFIADNFFSNIRDLEGALNKVVAYSKLQKLPVTQELAEAALKDLLTHKEKITLNIPYIIETVAKHYKITVDDLKGKKRTQTIALPRQVAMYLSRKLVDAPLTTIGGAFGGRDHSTIIHGCDKIAELIESDSSFKEVLVGIEKKLIGG